MPQSKTEAQDGNRPTGWISSGRWIGALVVVAVIAAALVLSRPHHPREPVSAAAAPRADGSVPGTPVSMDYSGCGSGWSGGPAGRMTFAILNDSPSGMEVYLEDATTKKVYLDVENVGSSTTRSATVTLGPGRYRFYCVPDDTTPAYGATVQVTGTTDLPVTPGLVPITANDIRPLMQKYERWVSAQLPDLQRQVRVLQDDVQAGDLAAARAAWLTAHHTWGTLGAAYDAFGADGEAIDGLPSTTTTALADPQLVGFHKIEALLWSATPQPAARIAPYTAKLVSAVGALTRFFDSPVPHMSPIDVGLRAHEILEDAILHTLTGADDLGSHSGLDTIDANITGTYAALDVLTPVLEHADPDWAATHRALARAQRLVRSLHGPLQRLSTRQRERLDADLDACVELLSEVAVMTDPRPAAG